MKKALVLGALALAMVAAPRPALAQDEDGEKKFTIHGEVRTRAEYQEYMNDFSPDSGDAFSYWPYRIRLAAEGKFAEGIRGYVEIQNFGDFGNVPPDKAFPSFFTGLPDPLGASFSQTPYASFFFPGSGGGTDAVALYQGFIELDKIGESNISARIGRQEMTAGTELLIGDADFYSGVSFDGARGMWSNEKFDVNAFYFKTSELNNTLLGTTGDSVDSNFYGLTGDWTISDPIGTVGVYWLGNQIRNELVFDGPGRLETYGAHFTKLPSREQAFDWNIEAAFQSGSQNDDGDELDFGGSVIEGWFGWSFGASARHRVHVGGLLASGDDTEDDSIDSFQSLYGDGHAWGRLGNLDIIPLTNVMDINVGYSVNFAEKHTVSAMVHSLAFDTVSPGADDSIGTEISALYAYQMTPILGFEVAVANHMSGEALDDFVGGDAEDIMRVWGQARLRW
jgi:hypothetical protein